MKLQLSILASFMTLTACAPIYIWEIRNNKDTPIEIKVCGQELSYVNYNNSSTELQKAGTTENCKTVRLIENEVMPLVKASSIATPITFDDLGFVEIEITTGDGQISATGKEIMNLFQIE